ncbi:Unknown protein [Striga hermonthica]|uniref:Uncharacterized protein n=1 Tax=Striga hermonthica TaxID=68872 RepID=A0A9N7RT92_STRHE|nr:Unknown protein [Striga hermonthica]
MANHGSKFVSVNLNKSYGQQHQPSHHAHYPHFNAGGGSYGSAGAGRGRPGSGGAGGMLVLSRARGATPKVVPKLSIPPPLNLPSLRKEHEKFDVSGPGGPGAGSGTGSGSRPTSSGMGWTKPASLAAAFPEKNVMSAEFSGLDVAAGGRAIGSYMPPSARSTGAGALAPSNAVRDVPPVVDKAVLLRGEDFPSLQAARPVSSGTSQKQKDGSNQKQKHAAREEVGQDKEGGYHLGPLADMGRSPSDTTGNRLAENGRKDQGAGNGRMNDQTRKQEEYFPDPLPLVRMNTRSDWADDERDTSHGLVDQGRDIGYSNSESYWDRDFDLPRPSILPHKPAVQTQFDRWNQWDNETGRKFPGEVPKVDTYSKDTRVPSREGKEVNKWRNSPPSKDSFSSQESGSYRADAGNNNSMKENKYVPPHYGDTSRDGGMVYGKDSSAFGRSELGPVGQQHQQRNNTMESFNYRGPGRNSRNVSEPPNRYRGNNFQSNNLSRTSFASSGKLPHMADPLLNMGRNKRFQNSERSEDSFSRDFGPTGFEERDLFSEGLVAGVIRRKKDTSKLTDFHDPVRESFEAELDRVQKMQELERQRIIEEQERAMEQARREEEERQRRIREEEERRRKLEEEAREAAWRTEQERLEATRKAEEQRIAREEEKRRIQFEEERRKQAAKQKLEELEARMAKRQVETSKTDAVVSKTIVDEKWESEVKERHVSRNLDMDTWEDSERMVENVVASGSFDLSTHSMLLEVSSRPYPPLEGSSNFTDRGEANNSFKRDGELENGSGFPGPLSNQDTTHYSPRRDAFGGGRGIPRKEFYGGAGYMASRGYLKAGMPETYMEEFGYHKDHRWNPSPGNADRYGKFSEMEPEFHDSFGERYGDGGWGQGRHRVNTRPPYPERLYPHLESNALYNYGRSRYTVRQPRVLPPPSLVPSQRPNTRVTDQLAGSPSFLDDRIHYPRATGTESPAYYDGNRGGLEPSDIFGIQQENSTSEGQNLNNASRCDSQSSLSVSSPPTSPPHFSHDELEESGDSRAGSSLGKEKGSLLAGTRPVVPDGNSENDTRLIVSDNVSAVDDEEWTVETGNTLQQQEEYDEDEDGYREEDEVRDRDDGNLNLVQNFERLELEEHESPHALENVVLGFDEGVEVVIPSDDFEKTIHTQEKGSFEVTENAVDITNKSGTVDGFPSDPPNYLPSDDSLGINTDSSTNVPEEVASQSCIGQHVTTAALSDDAGLAARQTNSSTAALSQPSDTVPSSSSSGSQADLPVKLQFGLFSGPSLIPSPVPSIQIGSIQMPLHIHPPVGQSITTHMHPSQPPMFQFGQLRYTPPISQGILPMAPQSISFLQPNMMGHFNLNQNAGGSVANEPSNKNEAKSEVSNLPINNQPSFISSSTEQSGEGLNAFLNTTDVNKDNSEETKLASGSLAEEKRQNSAGSKSYSSSSKAKASELDSQHAQSTMQSVIVGDRIYGGPRGLGPLSGGRGRRFTYAVKNTYTRVSVQDHGKPSDSNGFQRRPRRTVQRTEFRVRENNDRRPPPVSSNNMGLNEKSNYNGKTVGVFARSGSKRDGEAKEMANDKSQDALHPGEANLKRTASENVEAPLQSGVICVFKQPGIEAPSDEDDFIEVRSKRQMLNDRREQREKEIKAKSRICKPPRKPHSSRPNDVVLRNHNKLPIPLGNEEAQSSQLKFTSSVSPHLVDNESTGYTAAASQLAVGTPFNSDAQASKCVIRNENFSLVLFNKNAKLFLYVCISRSAQAGSVPVVSDGRTERESGLNIDSRNKVMSLSQSQIDEVMKPAQYDPHVSTVGGHSGTATDPILPTSSSLTKEKAFSSGSSPISSLLAGEKIQFGAVTSPTVLPSTTHVASHVIGAPGSNRPDTQKSRSFPITQKDDSLFFSKEEPLSDSVQDCEAEAEAAASAVAVAAISSDEIPGNGSDAKSLTACVNGITTGVVGDKQVTIQSQSEDSLSVSLPADLSVETTPISLWPPLPSPQSSSGQMLSHFPTGPPSHFPFYEMNPLLGGPIFAFSPHEESSGNRSQPPKSVAPASGLPLGNWHSGVESFYGAPAGYPGPFIGPHGGIPGVPGPTPHMVVYNHFAPLGQYGQVGLSFMGATYIPSGKQGDWKNNVSASSAGHSGGEGDINNVNVSNAQRGGPNMTPPIQHLAPGSPLLPMRPPMHMFDVSPFQTAPDLPVQARWGQIPPSPIFPVSRPPQSQTDGLLPPQVNNPGNPTDQSQAANIFIESPSPTQSDSKSSSFKVSSDSTVVPFPSHLGVSDQLRFDLPASVVQTLPVSSNPESIKTDTTENSKPQNTSALNAQFPKKNVSSAQQGSNNYNNNNSNTSRYGYRRSGGVMAHRQGSGSEYSHRRVGYYGRNQSSGVDKGFHSSKVKQIYVAKQNSGAGPTD